MDWQGFLFDPQHNWIARFEKLARRRLPDVNLADQALEFALAKMQENNWARLNKAQDLTSPHAFLLCVYRHLIEDFAIARFGKCRAPQWLQHLGHRWQTLYQRLCCERQSIESLIARCAQHRDDEHNVREICRVIKAKIPHCGSRVQFQSLDANRDDHDAAEMAAPLHTGPSQQHAQQLCDEIVNALTQLLDAKNKNSAALSADCFNGITIDNDTRLLLRMIYQDDISLPKAAALLGIAEHNARRQIKRTLTQIAEHLQRAGFNWQDWSQQHE